MGVRSARRTRFRDGMKAISIRGQAAYPRLRFTPRLARFLLRARLSGSLAETRQTEILRRDGD
jgi:hypothetical protein